MSTRELTRETKLWLTREIGSQVATAEMRKGVELRQKPKQLMRNKGSNHKRKCKQLATLCCCVVRVKTKRIGDEKFTRVRCPFYRLQCHPTLTRLKWLTMGWVRITMVKSYPPRITSSTHFFFFLTTKNRFLFNYYFVTVVPKS